MRRMITLFALFVFCYFGAAAQPRAYESKVEYQKTQQAAAAIDLPYNIDLVENAVKDRMSRKGLKGSSLKGFTVYRGVQLGSAGDSAGASADLHIKVDRKSHDRGTTIVTVIATHPSEDPAGRTAADADLLERSKSFLNDLIPTVEANSLEGEIGGQDATLKKSQKKFHGLQDDQSSLEKKLRYAQADLEQNKKDQVTQAALVQTNINGNEETLKKAQKKMNKLMDDHGSLQKKIRNYQSDLAQNKKDQEAAETDAKKQQESLESMKTRRK